MARARYVQNKKGLGLYMRQSEELKRCIRNRAQRGANLARSLAPIGTDSPNPGEFRDSIRVVDHPIRDRFGARFIADARDAVWAEFGRTRTNRYRGAHALGRAARALAVPRRVI